MSANITLQQATDYLDTVLEMIETYEKLGPLLGMVLPFIEAFLPFLPLFVFVMANGAAFGLFKGFLYSWIGSSLGSVAVFLVVRRFGNKRFMQKIKRNRQVTRVVLWVERQGFGPLFILICFPFSPSSLINIVAGLSKISTQAFFLAVLLGKAVMVFSIAYIGSSLIEFAKHPMKTIIIILCIVFFWLFGKFLEKRFMHRTLKKKL
jgi:uncharacterized membrane protein YdjX (TVP38/TMEM64 family)